MPVFSFSFYLSFFFNFSANFITVSSQVAYGGLFFLSSDIVGLRHFHSSLLGLCQCLQLEALALPLLVLFYFFLRPSSFVFHSCLPSLMSSILYFISRISFPHNTLELVNHFECITQFVCISFSFTVLCNRKYLLLSLFINSFYWLLLLYFMTYFLCESKSSFCFSVTPFPVTTLLR